MSLVEEVKSLSLKDFQADGFDESEYKKVRLSSITEDMVGQKIKTFGWITNCRPQKNFSFIDLSLEFETLKCVVPGTHDLTFTTSLTIFGELKKSDSKKDSHTYELFVSKFVIYNGTMAPSFPLNEKSDKESRLDYGHLALRLPERALSLKARSNLLMAMREFYHKRNFTEITPPTLVQNQVEGGATLFGLKYYDQKAYLTQSSQLYLESTIASCGNSFCIMPSYRAEKSRTSRHLSEYTHVEGELTDIVFDDLLQFVEDLVRYSTEKFYEKTLPSILKVQPDFKKFELSSAPFKRITYSDAIEFLKSKNHLKADSTPYAYLDDISDASERFLCAEFGGNQPVFLTHFPAVLKAFYMKRDGELTESSDLLFPGIGEIMGGSMRLDDAVGLQDAFVREGLSAEEYSWYIDLSRFGPSSHGGYGVGFERLLMGLMGYPHVDDATLYPRKVNRCKP